MTEWRRQEAILYLSAEGRAVFADTFDTNTVDVLVEWADELGLWIRLEKLNQTTTNVMLIRWSHFDTAIMDAAQPDLKPPGRLGFVK